MSTYAIGSTPGRKKLSKFSIKRVDIGSDKGYFENPTANVGFLDEGGTLTPLCCSNSCNLFNLKSDKIGRVFFKMLKFSKKFEYALIVMLDLASRPQDDLVTTRSLAEQYRIPPEILGKVLQILVRKDLLNSVQGVKGGYILNCDINQTSIYTLIKAVDGPIKLVNCFQHKDACGCDQESTCNIRTPMEIIQDELVKYFSHITLRDIKNRFRDALFPGQTLSQSLKNISVDNKMMTS